MGLATVHGARRRCAVSGALVIGVHTGCGGNSLPAPEAAERYPTIASVVADVSGAEIAPLSSDRAALQVGEDSDGYRVTGANYESEDLLGTDAAGVPDLDRVAEADETVLADHGFEPLECVNNGPKPMAVFAAQDTEGGTMRVVVKSRPGRPTVRLWWSARVDTEGTACDQGLLG